jgi:hypothetical protein
MTLILSDNFPKDTLAEWHSIYRLFVLKLDLSYILFDNHSRIRPEHPMMAPTILLK